MTILTLAGSSSRFFNEGYSIVKYKLLLKKKTIINYIIDAIPLSERVIIVLNKKFQDKPFFEELLSSSGFKNYSIVEIDDSRGQLETVVKAFKILQLHDNDEPFLIFNGDTIRHTTLSSSLITNFDGYLETFEQEGNHWSFVDRIGIVNFVTEKNRISSYCCTGLYGFKSTKLFWQISSEYLQDATYQSRELYVAPIYNLYINKGYLVYSELIDQDKLTLCGTPQEYLDALKKRDCIPPVIRKQ